jgi:hypothetical protein
LQKILGQGVFSKVANKKWKLANKTGKLANKMDEVTNKSETKIFLVKNAKENGKIVA